MTQGLCPSLLCSCKEDQLQGQQGSNPPRVSLCLYLYCPFLMSLGPLLLTSPGCLVCSHLQRDAIWLGTYTPYRITQKIPRMQARSRLGLPAAVGDFTCLPQDFRETQRPSTQAITNLWSCFLEDPEALVALSDLVQGPCTGCLQVRSLRFQQLPCCQRVRSEDTLRTLRFIKLTSWTMVVNSWSSRTL